MVNLEATLLDATFAALADPTRRAILSRLTRGETTMGELAAPFRMSLPAVSKHVSVLERAGLVRRRRQGRVRRCRLVARPMREAADWIGRYRKFWEEQLDQLARYLERHPDAKETATWLPPSSTPRKPTPSASAVRSRRRRPGSSGRGPTRKS